MQPDEYRKMAAVEDAMWYYRALHRHVIAMLRPLLPSAVVLDAGCGSGGLLKRLRVANGGWRLTGLDFSSLACDLARERTDARIMQGSVTELPFQAESFDAIVSCDVLCQIDDPLPALLEFNRCLQPGGLVVINVPAYKWLWSYHDEAVQSKLRFDRHELIGLLKGSGFKPDLATYWNMLPFPLVVARRKLLPPPRGGSDVRLYPAPVEAMFNSMMGLEHLFLRAGVRLPWGSSILAVARKPGRV